MMSALLEYGMRYGHVWSNDDASAVAIWLHPESGPMTMPRMLRAGMWRAPFTLGLDGLARMSKAMSATQQVLWVGATLDMCVAPVLRSS